MLPLVSPRLIDLIQAGLDRHVDSLQDWLAFWTCVVTVGLMLEYGGDLAKISCERLERERKRRPEEKQTTEPLKIFRWIPSFVVIGAILVTLGVAGELYVEALVSGAE